MPSMNVGVRVTVTGAFAASEAVSGAAVYTSMA
jgi:hypothetical protein